MDARVNGLETLVVSLQSELQKTRYVVQDLLTAVRAASEDVEKAMTRIEALEFEWSLWNTCGDGMRHLRAMWGIHRSHRGSR